MPPSSPEPNQRQPLSLNRRSLLTPQGAPPDTPSPYRPQPDAPLKRKSDDSRAQPDQPAKRPSKMTLDPAACLHLTDGHNLELLNSNVHPKTKQYVVKLPPDSTLFFIIAGKGYNARETVIQAEALEEGILQTFPSATDVAMTAPVPKDPPAPNATNAYPHWIYGENFPQPVRKCLIDAKAVTMDNTIFIVLPSLTPTQTYIGSIKGFHGLTLGKRRYIDAARKAVRGNCVDPETGNPARYQSYGNTEPIELLAETYDIHLRPYNPGQDGSHLLVNIHGKIPVNTPKGVNEWRGGFNQTSVFVNGLGDEKPSTFTTDSCVTCKQITHPTKCCLLGPIQAALLAAQKKKSENSEITVAPANAAEAQAAIEAEARAEERTARTLANTAGQGRTSKPRTPAANASSKKNAKAGESSGAKNAGKTAGRH
ncbi:hypothetical protein DL93DRAFT_2173699 [Clavulina sp. PMI_390]|nr:hypothetical protein DL93DRAFT_2173699 [Clavulina sp. PMI_390]